MNRGRLFAISQCEGTHTMVGLALLRRRWWLIPLALVALLLVLAGLFAFNGLVLAYNETPITGFVRIKSDLPGEVPAEPTIKILAYNIAKGFVHQGGLSFAPQAEVEARIDRIAATIRAEDPDLVFLSEAILECGPCPINQVQRIAEKASLPYWVFGENFNFGLPGYRIVGGNAILAKQELIPVGNPSLAGRQPFYVTKNNRRVLWCQSNLAGQEVLLASIHTDSFDLANNQAQTEQILAYCGDRPAILAGDFNAQPHESSIQLIRDSNRFAGWFAPVGTFPSNETPDTMQTIDFIFAPATWQLVDHRVLRSKDSDHCAVVSTFRVP